MVQALFFAAVGILLGLLLLLDYVRTRFRHTAHSRRVLLAEGGGSLVTAGLIGFFLLEGVGWLWRALVTLLIAFPLFAIASFSTVEFWRRRKQEHFDREILRLAREIARCQERIDRLIWRLADLRKQQAQLAAERGEVLVRLRAVEDQVQAWQELGADPKARARQLERWKEELRQLDDEALQARRRELAARPEGLDAEAVAAQLNLIELIALRRALESPQAELARTERKIEELEAARRDAERRLEELRREADAWQERKSDFLKERILLD